MIGRVSEKEKVRFKYRTAGIALKDDYVLIHQCEGNSYWSLPGGHVEMMETTSSALEREIAEEINIRVKVDRLVWTTENFYRRRNKLFHEVAFYYLISFPENQEWYKIERQLEGFEHGSSSRLIFRWIEKSQIAGIELYPVFLKTRLLHIPDSIEHIIMSDFD
jgi:ADP-ribose pyrophosphatase YjhB (NUDIX family)